MKLFLILLCAITAQTAWAKKSFWIHGSNIANGIWISPSSHPAPGAFTSKSRVPEEHRAVPEPAMEPPRASQQQVHYAPRREYAPRWERDYHQEDVCREALWHATSYSWKSIKYDCRSGNWGGSPYTSQGRKIICRNALYDLTNRSWRWIKRTCRMYERQGRL